MWVRGHSRSLKIVPFESLGMVSYSPSIVTMAVSSAILEIFNVEEWPDLEIWVTGRSRSFKMARFDRPCLTFYWSAIVTIALSCTVPFSSSIVTMAVSVAVCETYNDKEWCDLENRVKVRSRLLEIAPFDRFSDLLVENRKILILHLYLAPPQGMTLSEFREDV